MVKYLVADGYFMKHDFSKPLLKEGLHIITKMRPDADLRYTYNGPKQKGRGRPKCYDGKVDPVAIGCKNIDKRRIKKFNEDQDAIYYTAIVYCNGAEKFSKDCVSARQANKRICHFFMYRYFNSTSIDRKVLPVTFSNRISNQGCQAACRIRTMPGKK